MQRKHYHVGQNTSGYLPESDPVVCSSRRTAESIAIELKNQWLEDNWQLDGTVHYVATGSARSGDIWIDDKMHEHFLPVHIWIEECQESGPDHEPDC